MLKSIFARQGVAAPLVEQNARPERSPSRERSISNEMITPESALSVTAVLASFTILSEDIASLPLNLYRRLKGGGKSRAFDNPYYGLMHDSPNLEHTSMIFREIMMGHLLGWGNFYGQMIWDESGVVTEIWPLRPDRMEVSRKNGQRVYLYTDVSGSRHAFTQDDILHVPAFGFDGLIGYSRISMARNAIGLALATEKYGSKFFSNGARPGVVIKTQRKDMKPSAIDNILKSWNQVYQGSDNSQKTAILEEGMEVQVIGIPPEDAQFLQTREFQVGEIARIFRVPPHMIGDTNKATSWGTGIESQEQGYVNHTLRPWMVRIEQILNQQILLKEERAYLFFEHMVDGLLRGDIQVRYASYVQAINNGILSPNEVRAKENLNAYEGGDEYYHQLNTAAAASVTPPIPTSDSSQASRVLGPLVRDAVSRIVKREVNDVRGAARRFLVKGQFDAFYSWATTFYASDHPMFVFKQLDPVLESQKALTGQDDSLEMHSYFLNCMDANLNQLTGKNIDQVESILNTWAQSDPETMTSAILKIIGDPNG